MRIQDLVKWAVSLVSRAAGVFVPGPTVLGHHNQEWRSDSCSTPLIVAKLTESRRSKEKKRPLSRAHEECFLCSAFARNENEKSKRAMRGEVYGYLSLHRKSRHADYSQQGSPIREEKEEAIRSRCMHDCSFWLFGRRSRSPCVSRVCGLALALSKASVQVPSGGSMDEWGVDSVEGFADCARPAALPTWTPKLTVLWGA